jgi:hypothetical protein
MNTSSLDKVASQNLTGNYNVHAQYLKEAIPQNRFRSVAGFAVFLE